MTDSNGKVEWKVFILAMGTVATLLGFMWSVINRTDAKIDGVKDDMTKVRADVSYIRGRMDNLKDISGLFNETK